VNVDMSEKFGGFDHDFSAVGLGVGVGRGSVTVSVIAPGATRRGSTAWRIMGEEVVSVGEEVGTAHSRRR
jgi:hypothetical protein